MNKQEQKQLEKEREVIKSLWKDLEESARNLEGVYVMPQSLFNIIVKKIQYLEDALKDARKSRDNWKCKYSKLKQHKMLKNYFGK